MKVSNVEEKEEEPRTVVVGIKMDAESRELLTWALVKVARAGDRVVALHVFTPDSEVSDPNAKCSSLLSLVKSFDSVLAVYDGFCNLKQIDLKLKLCRGSSIKQVLVRETKNYEASSLILGIKKNHHSIRHSSTSIARHCAKKLPKDCSVLAVNNGKIVFQREAIEKRDSFEEHIPEPSDYEHSSSIRAQQLASDFNSSMPSFNCLPVVSRPRLSYASTSRNLLKDSKSSVCSSPRARNSLSIVPVKKSTSLPNSVRSLILKELNEVKSGWPVLPKAVLNDKKPRVSVRQWAGRLPSRHSAAARHSDCNNNSDSSSSSSFVTAETSDSEKELPEELKSLQEKYSSVCRLFSFEELKHATSGFPSENLIGQGGSSLVYKGCLHDGKEIAVKLLKQSDNVLKEFVSEIEIITTLHHMNIISLHGFCFENDSFILVYDFLSRGSLEEILHGESENKDVLSWAKRYKIALGVAEALEYLHGGGSAKPVVHRDVKSSNILLSDDFDIQLADFGLAMWSSTCSMLMTCNDVAGTFGYLAPEYFMHGKVNEKIDVFAFGVVLLELLSGRKPISSGCPKGEESLVMWAKKILQEGKVKQLVDPSLGDEYDNDQLDRMILAASLCIRQAACSRPRMARVKKLLEGDPDVLQWAKSQANTTDELNVLDEEEATDQKTNIQSHINLAFLDVVENDDSLSVSSVDYSNDFISANTSLEDYLKGRYSRSSSFD